MVWLGIIIYSASIGAFFACKCRNNYGVLGSFVLPFFGFFVWSLVEIYLLPYNGGGAPMYLVAYIILLPLTTIPSFMSYMIIGAIIDSKKPNKGHQN